ncbi:MAG: hypothetical protein LH609_22075 [Rudanella sp.]|nr:hypothetical protein [Rudanella sp.]
MLLDRFSSHADIYARYLIDYPDALYDFVLSFVTKRGAAWDCDPVRQHVENRYAELPFDFANPQRAGFTVERYWTAEWFLNYLRTWSAVRKFMAVNGHDPVDALTEPINAAWGPDERLVQFPVFLRLGQI